MGNRRMKHGLAEALTLDQEQHLVEGWCLDGCKPAGAKLGYPFKDEVHRRAVWEANRERIMAMRGKDDPGANNYFEGQPTGFAHGSRPHAWWNYDNPVKEPRQQTAGEPVEPADERLTFGTPALWERPVPGALWESQYTYLKRHGLLFPGEEGLVREKDKLDTAI
jgi:hypothetical protein